MPNKRADGLVMLTVWVEKADADALAKRAKTERTNMSELIREGIERKLNDEQGQGEKTIRVGGDPGMGNPTTEGRGRSRSSKGKS